MLALADEFDIAFAPSATMHTAALRRAAVRAGLTTPPFLVAVADPTGGDRALPAARAEVAEIAHRFGQDDQRIAVGADGTAAFLRRHAANATHLHLACHATGAMLGFRESGPELADGVLPLTDLSRIGPLTSRVAVASACQTAMPDADLAEEGYSIAAVLLAAGSAAAIASLWSVDDLATAILMIRFYELVLDESDGARITPAQALRRAQVWLRDLPRSEVLAFVAAYPLLSNEASRRRGAGDEPLPDGDPPYVDPSYWGAFIAMGA